MIICNIKSILNCNYVYTFKIIVLYFLFVKTFSGLTQYSNNKKKTNKVFIALHKSCVYIQKKSFILKPQGIKRKIL